MVTLGNGTTVDKRHLDNNSSGSIPPKYKIRKVSALRDFPPFCGPNAPPVNDSVVEAIQDPTQVSLDGLVDNDVSVACNGFINHVDQFEIDVQPLGNDSVEMNGGEGEPEAESKNADAVVVSVDSLKAWLLPESDSTSVISPTPKDKFRTRRVSAIRDFPPFCGPNTPPLKTNIEELTISRNIGKEIVVFSQEKNIASSSEVKLKKKDPTGWRQRSKVVAKKSVPKVKEKEKAKAKSEGEMMVSYEGGAEPLDSVPFPLPPREFNVSLFPFGPNTSNLADARNKVRDTLRCFQAVCRKLLQGEEAKSGLDLDLGLKGKEKEKQYSEKYNKRIDLQAAKIIKVKGKEVNTGVNHMGAVPGVEVGDEFQYRVELAIVGVHRLYQGGIDYMKKGKTLLVTSIVASGGYADDMEDAHVLVYSGQGGNVVGKNKIPQDQKLERGNLAMKNSITERNPVRVIRGSKETKASESSDVRDKIVTTYVYDGLYTVDRYWTETGPHGKMVFKFELKRMKGQPEVAWKEVNGSKKSKQRDGVCVDDISKGKESFPVCAVNTISSEKPPEFTYITKMMYPDWFQPIHPKGCDCKNGKCSDSRKCSCAVKNGGEIPYNYNGAIVEVKNLVYECGPGCKCPPSCYNRVTQRGTKLKIEIFKTESRGWGVRSLAFIPSGTFICEYTGELLDDKEAEQRTGDDEYLFDIGRNYSDCSSNSKNVEVEVNVSEDGGYTIDAAHYGNIGRFINHSCTPNLYAQNVLYDHEDTRLPHIMLFAAENIPALQELTYHYNYQMDQVRDSNGNIKKKSCFCGSAECTGRMY